MDDMDDFFRGLSILGGFIGALLIASLVCMAMGCSRKVYVPVESVTVRTDTVYKERVSVRVDTFASVQRVYVEKRDSIAPILDSLQRVIGFNRWHFVTERSSSDAERVSLMAQLDSLRALKTDSIVKREPYPVETVREVNRLHRRQLALMGFGIGWILWVIWKIWRYKGNWNK